LDELKPVLPDSGKAKALDQGVGDAPIAAKPNRAIAKPKFGA
jgi:hypothetical protein